MKTILLTWMLTFLVPSAIFAQGPIRIKLTSGGERFTSYAYLSNGYAFSSPHVQIDSRKGEKIPITSVSFIEGTDQNGKYRYFEPIYRLQTIWAERSYASDRVKIYYTDIETGNWNLSYKSKFYVYKKDESSFKKLKMKNLKIDLADNEASMDYLKKARTLQWIQAALYVSGAAILVSSIVRDFGDDELSEPGETPGIPPGIIIGGITLNIPWFINPAKQKHYTNALKAFD